MEGTVNILRVYHKVKAWPQMAGMSTEQGTDRLYQETEQIGNGELCKLSKHNACPTVMYFHQQGHTSGRWTWNLEKQHLPPP